ncbi:hypothetical protein BDY21DRAFT_205624 [Lineolata rhizophorae]|uniref:Uncharacterized protein n=1 Tax=Lineolata rhizophorae TaxID=578093 RepID=A0A6A6P3K1_9PEZI|nr:hypothetical protein BDY21DRAFT_205624 [Lineolata rhizophorae]
MINTYSTQSESLNHRHPVAKHRVPWSPSLLRLLVSSNGSATSFFSFASRFVLSSAARRPHEPMYARPCAWAQSEGTHARHRSRQISAENLKRAETSLCTISQDSSRRSLAVAQRGEASIVDIPTSPSHHFRNERTRKLVAHPRGQGEAQTKA